MAGARRSSEVSLAVRLAKEFWRFDALAAARLLEALDGAPPMLAGRRSRAFPPGQVTGLERADGKSQLEIAGFGLADILPDAYLDMLRGQNGDALNAFLAPFEERLFGQRLSQEALLAPDGGESSACSQALTAILGLSPHSLPKAGPLRYTAGLIARRPASLEAISAMVQCQLDLPIRAEPFAGGQIERPSSDWSRIGRAGRQQRLGHNAILGKRAWNAMSAIRLVAGPVRLEDADSFVHREADRLLDLAQFAAGPGLAVKAALTIQTSSISGTKLDRTRRLGQTSFLGRWRHKSEPRLRLGQSYRAA